MPGARDGQLRIHRGTDSPPWALQMFDDDLGLWLTLCQADVEEDAMRAGIPILRGPCTWDFTLTPHDGNVVVLLPLLAGEALLALWAGNRTFIDPDEGTIDVGTSDAPTRFWENTTPSGSPDDYFTPILQTDTPYLAGADTHVQIRYNSTSGDLVPSSQGHMDVYALVARAVAP